MGEKNETHSYRVPEWHLEIIESVVEEENLFDGLSDFSRFADRYVAEQLFGISVGDKEYQERRKEIESVDWSSLSQEVDRYFEGLLAENPESVEMGVKEIRNIDHELGDKAEKYAEKFAALYWEES